LIISSYNYSIKIILGTRMRYFTLSLNEKIITIFLPVPVGIQIMTF